MMSNRCAVSYQADLEQARSHYSAGWLYLSRIALHRHLVEHKQCGRGRELLGMIYHRWREWDIAVEFLEEASVRVPLQPMAECALADCYRATQRFRWARTLYRGALHRRDACTPALLAAAAGLDALDDCRAAIAACRRAIQLDPKMAQSHFDLSYYLGRCGAAVATVEVSARRAIALDPQNLTFRIGLAGFLHQHQRSEEAGPLLNSLSVEHVQLLQCPCCLSRLIGVFEAIGDEERATWCRQRQEILTLTGERPA